MSDYSIYYRKSTNDVAGLANRPGWDILVSAFNSSQRVQDVFDAVRADEKHWLVLPEYCYEKDELPTSGRTFVCSAGNESNLLDCYFANARVEWEKTRICLDVTGFMRPAMLFLVKTLMDYGVKRLDVLFSEPDRYARKEETEFSDERVVEVRQVAGYEGVHSTDTTRDLLIIGAGYDHELIAYVAEHKDNARKVQLFGLPSLRPDMYQENILRATRASEAVGVGALSPENIRFAPANDPFTTANVLRDIVTGIGGARGFSNVYLCPVSTKSSTLGFALYYLTERRGTATSVIFPFCERYNRETSKGVSRIWEYEVHLPES